MCMNGNAKMSKALTCVPKTATFEALLLVFILEAGLAGPSSEDRADGRDGKTWHCRAAIMTAVIRVDLKRI